MSAPSICFLLDRQQSPHNDNHVRLPHAFATCGWQVSCFGQTGLCLEAGSVVVFEDGTCRCLREFDLVWHLGLGARHDFLDRMELLSMLPRGLLVTPVETLALRHGKLHLNDPMLAELMPETHASAEAKFLISKITEGDWVVKPAAGSFGDEVIRVNAQSPNLAQLLEQACAKHFAVLQRFVPLGGSPEIRVLFAEGRAIGSYGRVPVGGGPGNLARNARAVPANLDAAFGAMLARIEQWLVSFGIGFAAADFRAGHLIEINIANPGGLATIEQLTGQDVSTRVAEGLLRRVIGR